MSIQQIKNISHIQLLLVRPDIFWRKFWKKAKGIMHIFFVDSATQRFIRHNRKVLKDWKSTTGEQVILVEWQNIPLWHVQGLMFANILAKKTNSRIYTFGNSSFMLARAVQRVFRSLNVRGHLNTGHLTKDQIRRRDKIYNEVIGFLKTKEDVFRLEIHDILLGIDIYESYLREFNKPTVVMDSALWATVRYAIGLLVYWEDFFARNRVAAVMILHDCYLNYNVPCKVAYQRKIPVYMPLGQFIASLKKPHETRLSFYSYRSWFDQLTEREKKEGKDWAKGQMEKRFRGERVEELHYAVGSPFRQQEHSPRVVRPSDHFKVLICSHCFYDSPHSYGGMLFLDFYEWLKYLVRIAEKTDYDWYLKTHPEPLPGTLETIREILGPSSRIAIVPSSTSHQQLVKEGINCALTVYGTIGHEYPALGIPVVNAGYNPHVAYEFTRTPKTLEEYEDFLLNLKNLKIRISLEDIYEFYFMHYNYCIVDNIMIHSFRSYVLQSHDDTSSASYTYFLDGFTEERMRKSVALMEEFIDSGKTYLFLKGPINNMVGRPADASYLS